MLKHRHIKRVVIFFALLLVLSQLIPYISGYDPVAIDLENRLESPSLEHLWGTDELGRDVFSRVLHGFSTTVRISVFALFSSLVIGIFLGSWAGHRYGTWVDNVFNWVVSLIFSLPFLLIMVAVMSIVKPSIINAYIILSCVMWVGPARIARAEVIRVKNLDYVLASRALGASERRILLFTIMPAAMESSFIFSVSYFPEIIGLEAGLSFFGLGVQPPYPGLGKMIFEGLEHIYFAWWMPLFPSMVLFLVVMSVNLLMAFGGKESKFGFSQKGGEL